MLAYGDSKTFANQYQPTLQTSVAGSSITTLARNGYRVATMKPLIDADLAAITTNMDVVLFNLGVNDVAVGLPAQAVWEADAGYILDAFHAKWPLARVYMMRPWGRTYNAACDTLAGWIVNVVAARAEWAFVGPDERVFLENGDDGVTYTADGIHPIVPAGYALTAAKWRLTLLGY